MRMSYLTLKNACNFGIKQTFFRVKSSLTVAAALNDCR